MVKYIESVGTLSLFTTEKVFRGSWQVSQSFFFLPHVILSVHYKTISTIYVIERKILQYLVHVLQSNTPMNILQSYVHISAECYLGKSCC